MAQVSRTDRPVVIGRGLFRALCEYQCTVTQRHPVGGRYTFELCRIRSHQFAPIRRCMYSIGSSVEPRTGTTMPLRFSVFAISIINVMQSWARSL